MVSISLTNPPVPKQTRRKVDSTPKRPRSCRQLTPNSWEVSSSYTLIFYKVVADVYANYTCKGRIGYTGIEARCWPFYKTATCPHIDRVIEWRDEQAVAAAPVVEVQTEAPYISYPQVGHKCFVPRVVEHDMSDNRLVQMFG